MKSLFAIAFAILLPALVFAQVNCNSVNVAGGIGCIVVSGLSGAPIAGIQVFNSNWASVFSQTYPNPSNSITVSPLPAGQYFVNVRMYDNNWTTICEKGSNASVINSPPPIDSCDPRFQKTYGRPFVLEEARHIILAGDGNNLIAGAYTDQTQANYDGLLMKVDIKGNIVWARTYGGNATESFKVVRRVGDDNFIAGGTAHTLGSLNTDIWLVKVNNTGDILWQKRYAMNNTSAYLSDVIATTDGGFAFVGGIDFLSNNVDWMVVKTDANGNIVWQKNVGTSNREDAYALLEDQRGTFGIVVAGGNRSISTFDANLTKFALNNGNILWTKSYDLEGRTNLFKNLYGVTGGLLMSAMNNDADGMNAVHEIVKTDINGNTIWVKEYKIPGCQDGLTAVASDESIIIGAGEIPNNPISDVHLALLDTAGNVQWAKKYPRSEGQYFNSLLQDGYHIVAVGHSATDILISKSDFLGNLSTCSTVNETITQRIPTLTNINFAWPTVGNLSLVATNTSYAAGTITMAPTILCMDSCASPIIPNISIGNLTVNENVGGAVLQVCLSAPYSQTVTVQYATANGTAISVSDYTPSSNTLTIPAGQTCVSINIPIINDATQEPTESFTVNLSNATNANITNGTATITINDDDQPQTNCDAITMTPGNNIIAITGLNAPVATIQIFNNSWATVFNQSYTNSPGTVNVPIGSGTYLVKVSFYTSNWIFICDKSQNVTVINQCPAGTICISNICPAQTVDLNTAYSIPNLPAGTTVSWHTGNPATDANKMTAQQAQNVSVSGTYYAAINISGANCYSATIPVNVTITPCSSSPIVNAIELKSDGERATRKIMVFPNPFTSSVRVIIDSEKKEKATLMFTDPLGRLLQRKPILLVPGSNTVMLDGLDKYPSGNYFLQIASPDGLKSFKLIRQQ